MNLKLSIALGYAENTIPCSESTDVSLYVSGWKLRAPLRCGSWMNWDVAARMPPAEVKLFAAVAHTTLPKASAPIPPCANLSLIDQGDVIAILKPCPFDA